MGYLQKISAPGPNSGTSRGGGEDEAVLRPLRRYVAREELVGVMVAVVAGEELRSSFAGERHLVPRAPHLRSAGTTIVTLGTVNSPTGIEKPVVLGSLTISTQTGSAPTPTTATRSTPGRSASRSRARSTPTRKGAARDGR